MYDPNDRQPAGEPTELAAAVTTAAPTADLGNRDSAVVDAFAWSEEEPGVSAEPVPFTEDPYDLATGQLPVAPPPPGRPARGRRVPHLVLGLGVLVAMIAVAGALYNLTRGAAHDTPTQPTGDVDVPALPESSALPTSAVVTTASSVAPSPATQAPPPTTRVPVTTQAPVTTTQAPVTTTQAPVTTTWQPTTTAPPTTTVPSATAPSTAVPTTSLPPTPTTEATEAQVTTPATASMTTEYLRIPLVPIPIPITVPQP